MLSVQALITVGCQEHGELVGSFSIEVNHKCNGTSLRGCVLHGRVYAVLGAGAQTWREQYH